jgi:hypothetical protein
MCEGHLFEYGRARGSRIRRPNTKDHAIGSNDGQYGSCCSPESASRQGFIGDGKRV